MAKLSETRVFNNAKVGIEGWYWALPSRELKPGQVKGIEILGRKLAIFRGESGKLHAIDAYCPHMGAHFKEGKVEGDSIRCAFHGWKFNEEGQCVDIPCQAYAGRNHTIPPLERFQVAEKYGLIWVHTGRAGAADNGASDPLPQFSDFDDSTEIDIVVGRRTTRPCRPEVVMLNAIDAHHFNTVHPEASKLADGMQLVHKPLGSHAIRLENKSPVAGSSFLGRFLQPLYRNGALTYFLDYWYGSTGVVTLGPDFLHLYLLFPHRPTLAGGSEGIMVFIARRRKGILGRLMSKATAWVTMVVGSYFERGDREIFQSIRFEMKAPVKADQPIVEFIRHAEKQSFLSLPWKSIT